MGKGLKWTGDGRRNYPVVWMCVGKRREITKKKNGENATQWKVNCEKEMRMKEKRRKGKMMGGRGEQGKSKPQRGREWSKCERKGR